MPKDDNKNKLPQDLDDHSLESWELEFEDLQRGTADVEAYGEPGAFAEPESFPRESDAVETALAVQPRAEAEYDFEELRQFSHHLTKDVAFRYRGVILKAWTDQFGSQRYDVGLVHYSSAEHRNGIVRSLRVSPLHVKFVLLDDSLFQYLFGGLYSLQTQLQVQEQQQKKQSQTTKNWGEGETMLSADEKLAAQAAAEADFRDESEEWIDLTNTEEYDRNIKRNEAELTTQEFIRLILMEFLRSGSSDMHIEAGQPTGRIRFRYDSEMFTRWDNIPFVKIKQLAMGMAETAGKDATQMKFKDIDSTVKVRVIRDGFPADVELRFASQPTLYSPSVVLRSQLKPIRDINAVGFLARQIHDLKAAYSQKRGIIVVTGATGSGKTNTLESIYAALEETDTKKIIEIGEPVEIRSVRRTQISLRPNTPFSWWDAFYSCLRSDPDIIGIGELRSAEHVSVAINAALTGHLVLSTFHAASVEDTLSRLFQMGIPRENLATGLNLILAQTLVRKLCERCKIIDPRPTEVYERVVYKGKGCPECFHKGTRGRTAMAELLYFNDEVKEWIQDRSLSARDVVNRAIAEGALIPMKTVAREKVLAGLTSELEVAAVLGLVESKRQYANRSYAQGTAGEPMREPIERHDDYIEGEIVG